MKKFIICTLLVCLGIVVGVVISFFDLKNVSLLNQSKTFNCLISTFPSKTTEDTSVSFSVKGDVYIFQIKDDLIEMQFSKRSGDLYQYAGLVNGEKRCDIWTKRTLDDFWNNGFHIDQSLNVISLLDYRPSEIVTYFALY